MMNHIKKNTFISIRIDEVCYYLFWMIMLFAKGIGLYEGMQLYNICLILAFIFLGIKLVLTEYKVVDILSVSYTHLKYIWVPGWWVIKHKFFKGGRYSLSENRFISREKKE